MRITIALVLLFGLCACKVGPNYKRPAVALPDQYRGLAPSASPQPQPSTPNFAEMKWWTVFQDKVLEDLIREALTNNYDLRIAATRILQAKAQLGITRADQFPSVEATGAIQNVRNQLFQNAPTFDSIGLQASYIVDFWGQFRRATEASRANLVATEYRAGGGANNPDLERSKQLLSIAAVRRATGVLEGDFESGPGDAEDQHHKVQRW